MRDPSSLLLWCCLAGPFLLPAQNTGLFEGHSDVGTVLQKGSVDYDSAAGTYTITASGENMWAMKDDFQYAWKKSSGDLTLTADISFPEAGGNAHKKGVLMIRQSLATDAAYVDVAVHSDGLTSLQAREADGAATHEVGINAAHPSRVRIEKRGDYFYMWLATAGQELRFAGGSMKVHLTGPFYVGIGACAHDKDATVKAVFSNVQVNDKPGTGKPVLYSTLETVAVSSTDRRVVTVARQRLESASWTRDGAGLQYKADGAGYRIPAKGESKPEKTEVQSASPESRGVTVVSADRGDGMQVWSQQADGADAQKVTTDEYTNCFPHLSPDGKLVAFLSYEQGTSGCSATDKDVMLRVVALADRKVKTVAKLIGGKGALDGASPWSPDGKSLTYVSYQYLVP